MKAGDVKCRLCGSSVFNAMERGAWIQRVNPTGEDFIGECRPSCESNDTDEPAIIACLNATGESDEGKLMTSLDNQTSSDNPDNNISPIENPGSLFSNSSKATAELSNRVRRHLERVDEREYSLNAWNCICDALGELE